MRGAMLLLLAVCCCTVLGAARDHDLQGEWTGRTASPTAAKCMLTGLGTSKVVLRSILNLNLLSIMVFVCQSRGQSHPIFVYTGVHLQVD